MSFKKNEDDFITSYVLSSLCVSLDFEGKLKQIYYGEND
jgi:hypothetical protein